MLAYDRNVLIMKLKTQSDTFRTYLEEYARKHSKAIRKNPEFRMHFQKMCSNIGVDPLACV